MKNKILGTSLLLFAISSLSLSAHATIDSDAQIVHLRTSCLENGSEIANCATTYSDITQWMGTTRAANAGDLTINVGPGTFGPLMCSNTYNLSVKGSGPNQTYLRGAYPSNCFNLNVQDLSINDSFPAPIYWSGDGSSTWTNVHVNGGVYAWTETNCGKITSRPVHRWFSSRLTSKLKTTFLASCSENWFFGSELVLEGSQFSGGFHYTIMVRSANGENDSRPEVHLYGSVLRVILDPGVNYSGMAAAWAGANGEIHIHGTGIDVIGNEIGNDITALLVSDGGKIHASQSSYVMKTGPGGTAQRIVNNGGTVKAPYLWETDILNLNSNFSSIDGADTTTEVVCNGALCFPHQLIYTSACTTNGPWFDTTSNSCRQ